ncbi:MAG: phosphatidate cytidylyltransferase [Deltaproteobacteria bacterium]|jgi:phosphatidate cytidylyltransferase|nr:phosphatidate cytidylyltransferase [Deltaproteobacteria bacterium]
MKTAPLPDSFARQLPRVVTGLLLAAVLVAALILGGLWLAVVLALVSTLALYEFFQMYWPGRTHIPSKIFGLFLGLMIFCPANAPGSVQTMTAFAFLWAALAFLFDHGRGNDEARLENHAVLPLGILYLPVVLQLALSLSLKEQFLVVCAAAASDTAAYYAGCAFGRHKIWPRVSPKKSWEGSIAGFAGSIAVTVSLACIPYGNGPLHGGNIPLWICIGALLALAAQFGDFFESALKRNRAVKDSSALLPGHGGILDRIDSILFTLLAYSALNAAAKLLSA